MKVQIFQDAICYVLTIEFKILVLQNDWQQNTYSIYLSLKSNPIERDCLYSNKVSMTFVSKLTINVGM